MALAKCRECSREISTTAKSCPHCGFSPSPAIQGKRTLIGFLTICGFLHFVFSGPDKPSQQSNPVSTPAPVTVPVKDNKNVSAARVPQTSFDTGRLRVCLTTDISKHALNNVVLPKWSMFTDDGEFNGNLREPYKRETYNGRNRDNFAELITTEPLTLTKDAPCGDVQASMWGSGPHYWPASKVHAWDFHHVLGYRIPDLPQPNKLSAIRGSLIIRAQAIGDITHWSSITEDEVVAQQPENPLNRIPVDM